MDATAHRLAAGTAGLVAVDLAGGLLAVGAGVNSWSGAWGSAALLAAPVPMIAVQVVLTWLAVTRSGRGAVVAAVTLSLACLVSVVSGFFDGGLGNDALSAPLVGFQAFLLVVTATVGALAATRAVSLVRRPDESRVAAGSTQV